MNITTAEKLMFKVMKAIFDSGIPVSFKGSMVLKACLIEAGYYLKLTADAFPFIRDSLKKSFPSIINEVSFNEREYY